jgi:apolipoprotein N-acyltransferase
VALSAIPPLCIMGWASPLVSAGVLFPNSAWLGLGATLALPGLLLHNRTRAATLLIAGTASLVLNAQAKPLALPRNWEAETTHIHRPRAESGLAEFNIEQHLQSVALSSRRAVLVFPEGAVRHWTAATDAFWEAALAGSGKTLFVGAAEPIPGSPQLHNSVIVVGDRPTTAVRQRIPVPGGMWNPFHSDGNFALNLFDPGTADVGGQRAAILICYEQLLTWPMLRSALERPTLLITVSNEAWTTGTTIPKGQHACTRAWARLFGLPVISSINS